MAEPLPNGSAPNGVDVEMKEEALADGSVNMNSIQPADLTDPQPPPIPAHTALAQAEQPAALMAAPTPPPAATRPSSVAPPPARPTQPVAHGGPTRQFLNQHLTPHLLEGMKYVAMNEPDKPLLWLSEFLRDRSKEVEG